MGTVQVTAIKITQIPFIETLLGRPVSMRARTLEAVAGWGRKRSGRRAEELAVRRGVQCWHLEDGFLRSFGIGSRFPGLAMIVDPVGIYYDATSPSQLEQLLAADTDLLAGIEKEVARAKSLILEHRLSKYNHAPDWHAVSAHHPTPSLGTGTTSKRRVLVVDQTAKDSSVQLGMASAQTFSDMLAAAYAENPDAVVYVKTHPEVSAGRKGGHLTHVQDDARTVMIRDPVNPISLIEQMDRVYVVSSTMGFEALLAGKPVTCLGVPWYAGWGVTDDRQACERRSRKRSVDELFAAAYFHYTRYLDPVTHQRGTIFNVIEWLVRQRDMASRFLPSR